MILFAVTGCKTETDNVELTGITVTPPAKLTYNVGEKLDTEGMAVTAIYSDETTKDVTAEATTAGYDETKAGEQTVIVSYTENEITQTAGFDVTVKAIEPEKETPKVELTKIEVTTEPAKKEYFVGEELNTAGIKVTATLSDSTEKDVTADVKLSGYDKIKAGEQTVTVSYTQNEITKTAEFKVTVKAVEVTKIEITTEPEKKKYFTGAIALDLSDMVVTATYNDGTTKDVTANVTTSGFDSSTATESQIITVTYSEKTDTFTVEIKQGYTFHNTVTTIASGITGSYGTDEATYVLFGDWPQDVVKEADVATLGLETSKDKVTRGYMEFVQGTDGNYYVKHESKWFKVMPIKWRVFEEAYDVDGDTGTATGKLLVAENILTANVPYYEDDQNNRTIDDKIVYPNNYKYSQIRAYLNGYKYTGYDTSSSSNVEKTQWNSKGFLQTAFTSDAIDSIITTIVDNSEGSTTDVTGAIQKATTYACDPTDDKIFLLSEYEVTKYSKSAEAYDSSGQGNSRIRVTTDFAKANNAYQRTTNDYGGYWWLRSPSYYNSYYARGVRYDGYAYSDYYVNDTVIGVVPALSISF